MKKNYLLLTLLSLLNLAYAQTPNFKWGYGFGGKSTDKINDIAVDSKRNVIGVGVFYSTIDMDPSINVFPITAVNTTTTGTTSSQDAFVTKFSSNGKLIWAYSFGNNNTDEIVQIKVDKNDNIYILGLFRDSIDIDPSANIEKIKFKGTGSNVFFAKYDSDFNLLWGKNLGCLTNPSSNVIPFNLDVDNNGNLFIVGTFQYTVDFNPDTLKSNTLTAKLFSPTATVSTTETFIAKYSTNGDFVWAKQIASPIISSTVYGGSTIKNLKFDTANNCFYIGGYYYGLYDLDPSSNSDTIKSNAANGKKNDLFIAKYDTACSYIWSKGIGGEGSELLTSMDIDANGNIGIRKNTPTYALDVSGNISASNIDIKMGNIIPPHYSDTPPYTYLLRCGGGAFFGSNSGVGDNFNFYGNMTVKKVVNTQTGNIEADGTITSIINTGTPFIYIKGSNAAINSETQNRIFFGNANGISDSNGWYVGTYNKTSFTGNNSNFTIGRELANDSLLAMSINTDGNVGIRKHTPTVALDVTGSISASSNITAGNGLNVTTGGLTVTAGGLTVTAGGLTVTAGSLNLSNGNITVKRLAGATTNGNIEADGDITAGSDERYKENIVTIDTALDKINKMRGVYFTRIGEQERKIGFIAQELERVLPEVVLTDKSEGQYKSVSYGNITAILVEGIKELKRELDELKQKFATLEIPTRPL
jgi:hypothetical protein